MENPTSKVCSDCGEDKPLDEYSPDKGGKFGRHSRCRPCNAAERRAWRKAHPERVRDENLRRRAYKREHERNVRATCPRCGGLMGVGSGYPAKRAEFCQKCRRGIEAERVAARDRELERLWRDGLRYKQIMAHFGWPKNRLAVEMVRARERGANLPYRYTTGKRAGRKFA